MSSAPGGATPAHPFADPRDATRVLEALAAADPLVAIDALSGWQSAVSSAQGLSAARRVELLLAIDAAARPHLGQLEREYLAAVRPSPAAENRLWSAIHAYLRHASDGCAGALEALSPGAAEAPPLRDRLPELIVRTLSGLRQRIKWMHFRYGPIDASAWGAFNRAYALAEGRGLADAKAAVPGEAGESTPRLEFLRGAMLGAVSPNSLLPQAIELAERVIATHAARFVLARSPEPNLPYWTDLGQAMPPQRMASAPRPGPRLRFFGAGGALEDLTELGRKLDTTGQLALAHTALGAEVDTGTLLEVLRHLAAHWAAHPPERRHMRHVVRSRLSVAHGFESVVRALRGGASPDGRDLESWVVEDVSAGGFGASVPQVSGDWLRVGALLALRPEGAEGWVVGVVRRVTRSAAQQARVGIQTLSKAPSVAEFSLDGASERGVLLKSGDVRSGEALIALRPGVFASGQELRTERAGHGRLYRPQGIAERGADYELAYFRELAGEA